MPFSMDLTLMEPELEPITANIVNKKKIIIINQNIFQSNFKMNPSHSKGNCNF